MPFDPAAFLAETTIEAPLDTKLPLIPINEYPAIIDKIDVRAQPKKDGDGDWYILDVTYAVEDASAREATGLEKPTIRDSLFLDMDLSGERPKLMTGTGKNVQLGRLLEALGINAEGFTFGMLPGRTCLIRVKHVPDAEDPANKGPWARVASVAQL